MHKKIVIIVITIIGLLALGGIFALVNSRDNTDMTQKESGAMTKENGAMMNDAMTKSGTFITLADFNADPSKYSDTKKVHFFHAGWCPICQSIEKEVKADMSKIPDGVTLIKTDFDSST